MEMQAYVYTDVSALQIHYPFAFDPNLKLLVIFWPIFFRICVCI
jgi:hypothetical protein